MAGFLAIHLIYPLLDHLWCCIDPLLRLAGGTFCPAGRNHVVTSNGFKVEMRTLVTAIVGSSLAAVLAAFLALRLVLVFAALSVSVLAAIVALRRLTSGERAAVWRDLRTESFMGLGTLVGLVFMAFGPTLSKESRDVFGLLWGVLAFAFLALLVLKTVPVLVGALRRR